MRSITLVAGARPNFMKIAALHRALREHGGFHIQLVHTGQHYDEAMSRLFFTELGLPEPDVNLGVGSGSHAVQTSAIMERFEPVLDEFRPGVVVVVGDVNSTVACGLVAKKKADVALAHVEAGLRSFDRTMPEEINRLLTDAISDLLYTSERSGDRNLLAEGTPPERIVFVGNVMIDTLLSNRERFQERGILASLGLRLQEFALMTLHRPANVDDPAIFHPLMDAVARIAKRIPVVFPVHPRTRGPAEEWRREREGLGGGAGLRMLAPLGYLDFLALESAARLVLTDSGGLQEEATVLGVPCLTLRENTERPVTVTEGTNTLVGRDPEKVLLETERILANAVPEPRVPEGWDGQAGRRIVEHLAGWSGPLR